MLLERLDGNRSLASVAEGTAALQILSELLSRLVALPAPKGLPLLADTAAAMLEHLPRLSPLLADPADRRLLATCGGTVRELLAEPGDRLLDGRDLHGWLCDAGSVGQNAGHDDLKSTGRAAALAQGRERLVRSGR